MKIIITIPAYNEEKTIGHAIENIKDAMKGTGYNYKILVYDDGSKDETAETAKKKGAIVYSHKRNKGLAETFRDELKACLKEGADVIVHIDADMQYDEKKIPLMIRKIEEGYDLVLGSRFRGKIKGMPFMKRFGNVLFSKTISWLTDINITDSTTGFRAFTRDVAEEIEIINTFTYTQEQIIRTAKHKFRITEIPVDTRETRASRLFSSPFNYAAKAWINIFRIYRDFEPLKFFGSIGFTFFLLGFILGLYIIYTWVTKGDVVALPRVMLSILLVMIGVQIILFGFLADMMKKQ